MFDIDSGPTIIKSVVESADSGIESADSTTDYAQNPLKIGLWVRAFRMEWNPIPQAVSFLLIWSLYLGIVNLKRGDNSLRL